MVSPQLEVTMATRLAGTYHDVPDAVRAIGRAWYPSAAVTAAAIAPTLSVGAGVIAALSPNTAWRDNVRRATAFLEGKRMGHFAYALAQARAIRDGIEPLEVLAGPKVRAFYSAIMGDAAAVPCDRWAHLAAMGAAPTHTPKHAAYRRSASAYAIAADAVGESPRDMQAIIWVAVRGTAL